MAGIGMGAGRWFERPRDGIIFRMDDPDHIARLLAEGWREVSAPRHIPTPTPTLSEIPLTPEALQERNDAARAAFSGAAPAHKTPKAKTIKQANTRGA